MRMAILWALFKAGGRLILADPKYTSQTCPKCGYTRTYAGAFRLPTLRLH